jgi:hypothetical protein
MGHNLSPSTAVDHAAEAAVCADAAIRGMNDATSQDGRDRAFESLAAAVYHLSLAVEGLARSRSV